MDLPRSLALVPMVVGISVLLFLFLAPRSLMGRLGIDLYGLSQERQADLRREYIGIVFQQFELLPCLTALENVMLPLAILKMPVKRDKALRALTRLGVDAKMAGRLPSELSRGEQGRVAIAGHRQ